MNSAFDIVSEWHTALNTGDVERLLALVHEDVEVGGPRGMTRGAKIVGDWFGRANVRLKPLRFFNRENVVVAEEQGEWFAPDTGQVTSSQVVATAFVVTDGLISRIMRYDNVGTALKEVGLEELDEVQLRNL